MKDPTAVLDYTMEWDDQFDPNYDPIASGTWTVPAGLVKDAESVNAAAGTHRVILSGGTAGSTYTIRSTVTTTGGLTDTRSVEVRVRDR